jgi:hypothetical protein
MKRMLFLALIFFSIKVFGQCPQRDQTTRISNNHHPLGEINDAKDRIDIYRGRKNHSDVRIPSRHRYTDSIMYSACGFLNALKQVEPKEYTGLRIYIGMNANNEFVLFFAPTLGKLDQSAKDDRNGRVEIVGKTAVPVTQEDFLNATGLYERTYWAELNKDGVKYRRREGRPNPKKYKETKALWYDARQIKTVSDDDNYATGLVDYLQSMILKDSADYVKVYFGAFLAKEKNYDYQIDLVFSVFKNGSAESFFGSAPQLRIAYTAENKIKIPGIIKKSKSTGSKGGKNDITFDTGIPCPPYPDKCKTCSCDEQ